MAHSLPTWREPEAVLALAELGVAEREGVGREDIARARCPGSRAPRSGSRFFDMPRIDISSTAGPRPRRRGRARSATSCPTRWPATSRSAGCTRAAAGRERA